MKTEGPITAEYFTKRLLDLCLRSGLSGFPKDETDQHILLKSAVLSLGGPGPFRGGEVDDRLKLWLSEIARLKSLDHVSVRRRLIDTGYLTRTADGSSYQIAEARPGAPQFDPAVDQVDQLQALADGREEIERRKQAFLEKKKT